MAYTPPSAPSGTGDHTETNRPQRGWMSVGTLASGREVAVPYMVLEGKGEGPCLWINAAVHGDEINGVIAALDFVDAIAPLAIDGTIVVTPVSNVLALDERRKVTAIDGIDMDQSFPGRENGFASERVAHALFEKFGRTADVIVNLHTLGTPYDAEPYAVYKSHPAVAEEKLLRMIACFEPTVACRMPVSNASGELPGNIAGALDYQGLAMGRAAFMIELGGGGRLEPGVIAHGVKGFMRLAALLGMIDGQADTAGGKLRRVTARAHKLAANGGFFRAEARPGTILRAGKRLGLVRNVFGDVIEDIRAERDSWVIATRRDPVVHTGDRVAFLATQWDEVDIHE